ncbi:uncharacterized protein LOC110631376 [Manihot esculenta]|uniref:Transmembrane protein n=1 Tax=Manihot esculenta TaxID=3983 RepID=A0A2C9UIL2_MANES|nr:uncharacterized protein LOC110631376 [Manihot esculenta]OAY30548.1 hypothetical protein MANES_14G039600v8 [Manihot esculenta]
MHRSASWNKVAVDYFLHPSQNAAAGMRISPLPEEKELPTYDPIVEMANKEKRIKFAENAVHVIPFLLMLCAFTLWFFSNPDVGVGVKTDSIAARIEGHIKTNSHATQTRSLPIDLDAPRRTTDHKIGRRLTDISR